MTTTLRSGIAPAGLAVLLLIFVLPFLQPFHTLPLTSFYSEWLALGLGTVALTLLSVPGLQLNLDLPRSSLLLFLFAGYIAIQGALVSSPYRSASIFWMLYLVWAGALIVLAATFRSRLGIERTATFLAWFALAGGALHALATGYSFLHGGSAFDPLIVAQVDSATQGASGQLAQRNQFASHLMLGVIAAGYLYAGGRLRVGPAAICIAPILALLTLSSSRSVWIYFGGVSALGLLYWLFKRDAVSRRVAVYCATVFLGFVALQELLPELVRQAADNEETPVVTSLDRLTGPSLTGIDIRTREWRKALSMMSEAPLLGVGAGNYSWYSYLFIPTANNLSTQVGDPLFAHTHNLFLQILAETGLAGFAILVFFLSLWLVQFLRKPISPEKFLIAAMLLVLFIHSNLEHPLWYSYFLGIAAILLGIGDESRVRISESAGAIPRYVAGLIVIVGTVISIGVLRDYQKLQAAAARLYAPDTSLRDKDLAALAETRRNVLLQPYADFLIGNAMILDRSHIEAKLELNSRIMHWRPVPEVVYKQSILLTLGGRTEEGLLQLREAAAKYPEFLHRHNSALKILDDPAIWPLRAETDRIWRGDRNW